MVAYKISPNFGSIYSVLAGDSKFEQNNEVNWKNQKLHKSDQQRGDFYIKATGNKKSYPLMSHQLTSVAFNQKQLVSVSFS